MRITTTTQLAVALVLACACTESGEPIEDGDDHREATLRFEGTELAALFGDGVSAPIAIDEGFRRVGVLWDAPAEDALEIRTSADGVTWSDWAAPVVVSREDVAHAGHVDTDGDVATWLQVRAGASAPTFLVIEPMPDIAPPTDPSEIVLETPSLAWDEQSTPIGTLRIYSRADWGARAPKCSSSSMNPVRATIHHTATPTNDSLTPQQRLRQIQNYQMDTRGWCDIGYNYLISRDGRVWRARGPTTVGAHVANNNTGNIGISVIGTHTSTKATATQLCSAAKLLRRLKEAFGISLARTNIKGHRQYGGTVCPGDALYNQINAILRKANSGCQVD
jgi:hypothetical protein